MLSNTYSFFLYFFRTLSLTIISFYILHLFHYTDGTNCDRRFVYNQHYGYGFEVYCDNLNNITIKQLHTLVNNELKLVITSSDVHFNEEYSFGNRHMYKEVEISNSTFHQNNITFNGLDKLQTLHVVNSNFNIISNQTFSKLISLNMLNLTNNSLRRIPSGGFTSVRSLKSLNLNFNILKMSQAEEWCEMKYLRWLLIKHNLIVDFPSLNCEVSIEELYLDFNMIQHIGRIFKSFKNLKKLSLKCNKVSVIGNAFDGLMSLEKLDLEGNLLEVLQKGDFHQLKHLMSINLSGNLIKSMNGAFITNGQLLEIMLDGNKLTNVDFTNMDLLIKLNLSHNHITSLNQFRSLQNLRVLDVSDNQITQIEPNTFANLEFLHFLNLSNNSLHLLQTFTFVGLFNLSVLNLSGNNITNVTSDAFFPLKMLSELNLSNNKLVKLDDHTFANLTNLKVLNISHNKLEHLRHQLFENMMFLNVLDVEANYLQDVEYNQIISKLPGLWTINIEGNLLSCEFLYGMIKYFKENAISYSLSEDLKYDKENVAGIYCAEVQNKLNETIQKTNLALNNNTALLQALYNMTKSNEGGFSEGVYGHVVYVIIILSLVSVCVMLGSYKVYKYYRRRNCLADELELINNPVKL